MVAASLNTLSLVAHSVTLACQQLLASLAPAARAKTEKDSAGQVRQLRHNPRPNVARYEQAPGGTRTWPSVLGMACGGAAAVAIATSGKRRTGRRWRPAAHNTWQGAKREAARDLYVRVLCQSVQTVAGRGAILGLKQVQNDDGAFHTPGLPIEIPVLLDNDEAEEFLEFHEHGSWTRPSLCEIRIHSREAGGPEAELLIADECRLPESDDGLLRAEAAAEGERLACCRAGEAFAMAMRLQVPVLLSTQFLLRGAKRAVDRLRAERIKADRDCDASLQYLSAALGGPQPSRSRIGELIGAIKPFAWYWSEHRRGGSLAKASLREFEELYQDLSESTATFG
mmetsp:Transcript_17818/g.56456  ORF Transcript_17818/g.56456 Transcript_17818/m.56456 type:complete len:340 (+) Transcript_17818:78-1097(+)